MMTPKPAASKNFPYVAPVVKMSFRDFDGPSPEELRYGAAQRRHSLLFPLVRDESQGQFHGRLPVAICDRGSDDSGPAVDSAVVRHQLLGTKGGDPY